MEQIVVKRSIFRELLRGAGIGLFIFPWILLYGSLSNGLLEHFFGIEPSLQPIVTHLMEGKGKAGGLLWVFAVIIIAAPIIEELVFRVGMISVLTKWWGFSTATAIILSSTLFSALHYSRDIGTSNVTILGQLFLLGCVLGKVYCQRRNVWAPFAIHATINGGSILLLYLFPF